MTNRCLGPTAEMPILRLSPWLRCARNKHTATPATPRPSPRIALAFILTLTLTLTFTFDYADEYDRGVW